jgi:zinc finger protein
MITILKCPVCKKKGLKITFEIQKIPYFGEVMESTMKCSFCRYRSTDVMILDEKEPTRYLLSIENEEDMSIRVVRSSRASIEIPEIGVKITPGPQAEGYISNVEGVLRRIENVLHSNYWNKNRKATQILDKIKDIKEGKKTATLILEDPTGNSVIASEKAKIEKMR